MLDDKILVYDVLNCPENFAFSLIRERKIVPLHLFRMKKEKREDRIMKYWNG